MSFNVQHEDMYNLMWEYKENLETNIAEFDHLAEVIKNLIEDDNFTGDTAESIKGYYNDIQLPIIEASKAVAQNILDNVALYVSKYHQCIENTTNFKFDEDSMTEMKSRLSYRMDNMFDVDDQVGRVFRTGFASIVEEETGVSLKKPSVDEIRIG